jgi:hypothetical protein
VLVLLLLGIGACAPKTQRTGDFTFALALGGAGVARSWDIESTFALKGLAEATPGWTFREANPLMAPFVRRGKPAAYAAGMGLLALGGWSAYTLKTHERWYWWVPLAIGAGLNTYNTINNFNQMRAIR